MLLGKIILIVILTVFAQFAKDIIYWEYWTNISKMKRKQEGPYLQYETKNRQ